MGRDADIIKMLRQNISHFKGIDDADISDLYRRGIVNGLLIAIATIDETVKFEPWNGENDESNINSARPTDSNNNNVSHNLV